MNCTRTVHELYTDCRRTVHGLFTKCTRTVHGQYTNCTRTVHGQYTDSRTWLGSVFPGLLLLVFCSPLFSLSSFISLIFPLFSKNPPSLLLPHVWLTAFYVTKQRPKFRDLSKKCRLTKDRLSLCENIGEINDRLTDHISTLVQQSGQGKKVLNELSNCNVLYGREKM